MDSYIRYLNSLLHWQNKKVFIHSTIMDYSALNLGEEAKLVCPQLAGNDAWN